MHPTEPFCARHALPDIMCGNFLLNYVEYEIITRTGTAYDLINCAFLWAPTNEGEVFWDRMNDKWCSFIYKKEI